jgi:methylenetetrahydrofolate dehydrogenase (NADP+) / methenyltetrahydrofolate cyclohydrolase
VPARIIDGNAVAARLRERVAREVDALGVTPGLATILVGDDPASAVYVSMKREDSAQVGIRSFHNELGDDVTADELAELIRSLNEDERVHGILLQLPLPAHLDQDEFIPLIDPGKDVDGLTPVNAGLLMQGREGLVPCTPAGVMDLLAEAEAELEGARAVVVGRSILVGKPLGQLLLAANATVTHCHSRTRGLAGVCREADVLIAAVGSPRLVTADMVREGAVVIDVGTSRTDEGLVGDVDFEAVRQKASAITPVPGGVGPMTRAMLLANTLQAARARLGGGRVALRLSGQPGSATSRRSSAERGSTP